MKGTKYTQDVKEQVLRDLEETGDMSLVARKHNIPLSTISTWIRKSKQSGSSSRGPNSANFNSIKASKEIEKENETLKKLLGEKDLEIAILKDLLKKTNQL